MKIFYLIPVFTTLLFFINGCGATHAKFVKKNNDLIGKNVGQLIEKKGKPGSSYILSNGHRVYLYKQTRTYKTVEIPTSTDFYSSPLKNDSHRNTGESGLIVVQNYETKKVICTAFFETDKRGIILKWRARGDHCVSE